MTTPSEGNSDAFIVDFTANRVYVLYLNNTGGTAGISYTLASAPGVNNVLMVAGTEQLVFEPTVNDTISIHRSPNLQIQIEDVTDKETYTITEYISNGVLAPPYHGTGVDGVKAFGDASGLDPATTNLCADRPYILVEDGATNYVLDSEAPENWDTAPDITVVNDNTIIAGLPCAKVISDNGVAIDTGTLGGIKLITDVSYLTLNRVYQCSVIVKDAGVGAIRIRRIAVTADIIQLAVFDFTTGEFSNVDSNTITYKRELSPGVWLLSWTFTLINTDVLSTGYLIKPDSNTFSVGDGVSGFYITAGQITKYTQYYNSYIPTTSAPSSRTPDVLSYSFGVNNFPQEFCYYSEFESLINDSINGSANTYRVFGTQDSTTTDAEIRTHGTTNPNAQLFIGVKYQIQTTRLQKSIQT